MAASNLNMRAPMSSAPLKYNPDGSVDWGNMWDSFCLLAQEGGPPHRGAMLFAPTNPGVESDQYRHVASEIIRGIYAVSGLDAETAQPGWLAIQCPSKGMAYWLKNAILAENVEARQNGSTLLVPCSEQFTLKNEIKNVITVVAKTTHYWNEHLPVEWRRAQNVEEHLERIQNWFRKLVRN